MTHTVEILMALAHSYATHFMTFTEHKHRSALRAALVAVQAVPAWLPIESAPKDGSEILVGSLDGSITVAHKGAHDKEFCSDGGYIASWATHWMPLPAAPVAKGAV